MDGNQLSKKNDKNLSLPSGKKWYKSWWGILLISLSAAVMLIVFAAGYQIIDYLQKLQSESNEASVSTAQDNSFESLVTKDDPSFGNPDASVGIVEFSDFECPYCQEASLIIRRITNEHKDRVIYVYRDFPVPETHPNALKAAEAGACAHEQGKFWAMHDKLFQNQSQLETEYLKLYAIQIGLNPEVFNDCLDSDKYLSEIEDDVLDGLKAGVNGTPTFYINGFQLGGVISEETWRELIEFYLNL